MLINLVLNLSIYFWFLKYEFLFLFFMFHTLAPTAMKSLLRPSIIELLTKKKWFHTHLVFLHINVIYFTWLSVLPLHLLAYNIRNVWKKLYINT